MYELLVNYKNLHGKKIKTCGFLIFSNERGIYPHFYDYKYAVFNSVYFHLSKNYQKNINDLKKFNESYCMIDGIVFSDDRGPSGVYMCTLKEVDKITLATRLDKKDRL